MTVLEDLWYGNIHPVENYIEGNMEYKSLLRLVSKNRATLENGLSQKQLELFKKYNDSVNEMNAISEAAAFRCGFTLAVAFYLNRHIGVQNPHYFTIIEKLILL